MEWMLYTAETPRVILKCFGCTEIHKVLYKCLIHIHIHISAPSSGERRKDMGNSLLVYFNLFTI